MQRDEEYVLTVEKAVNEGKFLCRKDGFPIFVENAAPGDEIRAKITKVNKSYAFADVKEIINPSKCRVKPICAFHEICGSCDWLHMSYDEQLKQKENIIREALRKFLTPECVFAPILPAPKQAEYRCKIQYPVSQTKNSKRILTGYYKKHSHELINIKFCPMNPPVINEINEELKVLLSENGVIAYDEAKHKGLLRHIIYRISSDFSQIHLIFVLNSDKTNAEIKRVAEIISKKYPVITSISANFNTRKTNVITTENNQVISGGGYYVEKLGNTRYKVSGTGFFQVNPYCAEVLFDEVKALTLKTGLNADLLDAYSGVSAFGIRLAPFVKSVVSVEEVKSASLDAEENAKLNKVENIRIINGDAAKEFAKMIDKGVKFDISITDPPRKGCTPESVENLCKLTSKYVIYVSCNVATLARDAELFASRGFKPVFVRGVDMFPNTYHVETIAMFKKF